ncbi:MAG: FAD:protein FMN transferase [Oscillospiraceae bacterium]|nr:FAD:protein FMN transferase [Oscillospiraceae bacterium]
MIKKHHRCRWAILCLALLAAAGYGSLLAQPTPREAVSFAMGSELTVTLWISDLPMPPFARRGADARQADILAAVQSLEAALGEAAEAPSEIAEIMRDSGGAYDPYLGALVKRWNIDSKDGSPPRVPADEEIRQALRQRVLDPGSYGKGAACDAALYAIARMRTENHGQPSAAVLNLGGNILTWGAKPWGKPFQIALRDPKCGENDTLGIFTLKGLCFISTSGSYEKFFEQDGKRYHHIFDPATGVPACRDPGLISVTVISGNSGISVPAEDQPLGARTVSPHGATGDALSTACFVLGYQQSLPLLEKFEADAVFIYEDGTVKAAGTARDYFQLTHPDYHWEAP